jgi:hypothetical protein
VTRTVRRLEGSGLVERLADPDDGRATIVALTAEGHRRGAVAMARMLEAFQDAFSAAGADDVSDLVEPLARLVDLLGVGRGAALADSARVVSSRNFAEPAAVPVGELLRRARLARGLTQKAVAATAGVGGPHLSKVEAGREQPGRDLLVRVAEVLGLDADELLLAAGMLPGWAATRAATDPVGAAAALRRWAGAASL